MQVVVLHKEVGVGLGFSLEGGVDQNKPITVRKYRFFSLLMINISFSKTFLFSTNIVRFARFLTQVLQPRRALLGREIVFCPLMVLLCQKLVTGRL